MLQSVVRVLNLVKDYVFRFTYYRALLSYFIIFTLMGALVVWGIELNHEYLDPYNSTVIRNRRDFIDCFLVTVTSMTCTGLISLDIQTLHVGSQVVLLFIMLIGGSQICTIFPVLIRRYYYAKEMKRISKITPDTIKTVKAQTELKCLNFLCGFIPSYWIFWQVLIAIFIGVSLSTPETSEPFRSQNVSLAWASVFLSVSSYQNAGLSVLRDNLQSAGKVNAGILILCMINILVGNTAYPVLVRAFFFVLSKFETRFQKTSKFLLDNPRKCYTHLFPANINLFLIITLICFNMFQFLTNVGLNWNIPGIITNYTTANALVNFMFTAVAVRTAGMNSLNNTAMNAGTQICFLFFMYVSSYPVALAIRLSSKSVEITKYDKSKDEESENSTLEDEAQINESIASEDRNRVSQVVSLLLSDVILLCFGVFLIACIESYSWSQTNMFDNIYRTIFDAISAYGTIGLTLGTIIPSPLSYCASFTVVSKLIIIAFMILGRFRMLPAEIDAAINLPLIMSVEEIRTARHSLIDEEKERESIHSEGVLKQVREVINKERGDESQRNSIELPRRGSIEVPRRGSIELEGQKGKTEKVLDEVDNNTNENM